MMEIRCCGASADCIAAEVLTSGMTGKQVRFAFDETWGGLSKTAVFVGAVKESVQLEKETVEIPASVLAVAGVPLVIGVRGESEDGALVIPTVYARCGMILPGADTVPAGAEVTPSQAQQLQSQIDELKKAGGGEPSGGAVSSVNGQTGTVVLNAEDVGALPDTTQIPAVPAALPNPNKLTFTGAVSAEYDGSEAVSVEIPEGGGGGESEWKLINTITLTEAVREVTISEDSDGKPLSLKEVIVRQNVSCAESSIQNETVYVNGKPVIGKMPIIKNTGYYGWADIVLRIEGGKVMAQCAYTDIASPTPGAYNPVGVGYYYVTPFANISYLSAEAINNLKLSCEVTTVTFAENSSFTVWGR